MLNCWDWSGAKECTSSRYRNAEKWVFSTLRKRNIPNPAHRMNLNVFETNGQGAMPMEMDSLNFGSQRGRDEFSCVSKLCSSSSPMLLFGRIRRWMMPMMIFCAVSGSPVMAGMYVSRFAHLGCVFGQSTTRWGGGSLFSPPACFRKNAFFGPKRLSWLEKIRITVTQNAFFWQKIRLSV